MSLQRFAVSDRLPAQQWRSRERLVFPRMTVGVTECIDPSKTLDTEDTELRVDDPANPARLAG